ncbi:amino acid ABC transporter permease [Marinomonas rhizomae]|uniref:Amino acid ABC transporter membrane protein 1 (PAAT family) n=1 Tax=Marinomonas rhizomae TaxID=491948 RepID=A0A366JDN6_9GAMM|nr:amino acid ABC transporter permease [Marinomonas rhizomae]RBP85101.1 amino acid ABC transporter membrane protein 1 (PAAT family) [Marinomonas rhizomae]RNF76210.1 amino acid ABC transporter permease [Marinomonas rhizomae]
MFDYSFHWRPVVKSLPELIQAGLVTLEIASLAMLLGVVIGLCLALMRMNMKGPLKWFAVTWIEIARNTPALFQLFFFGFGLGAFGINLSPFTIILTGLSFNCAGYLAENFRGGFQAIPVMQINSARCLGMNSWQAYTRIVIPQVLRIVYYPITNQMVWAVLMSSLGMLIGFRELSGETQFFASKTFRVFEYFAAAAVIYYVIVKIVLGASRLLAMRLFRY